MKFLRVFALSLIVLLLTGALVACEQKTGATEPTLTPSPTESRKKKTYSDVSGVFSTYYANRKGEVPDGTTFVVEKEGKWYIFIFQNGQLVEGEVFDEKPDIPEDMVLETDENYLNQIPEDVEIFIPEPTPSNLLEMAREAAYNTAVAASAVYAANIVAEDSTAKIKEGTTFVIEKDGVWFSFVYKGEVLVKDKVWEEKPESLSGLVLETKESHLDSIPDNIMIFIPKN